jgi:D-alanyl-D-alanine carboxypeptidase/D-alanyl-D-alanine-endopeptidase (penicillin-binding protein 4)
MEYFRMMKSLIRVFAVVCVLCLMSVSNPVAFAGSPQAFVDSVMSQKPLLGSSWSILFYAPNRNAVIAEYDPDRLLTPASVVKAITSAVAIDRLGPEYQFTTTFYTSKTLSATGTLDGELVVFAGGDPSMETSADDSLRVPWMKVIADSLYAHGLRELNGNTRLSPNGYRLECAPSSWEIGDVKEGFAPAIDGFGFNSNVCHMAIFPGDDSGDPAKITLDPDYAPLKVNSTIETGESSSGNWVDFQITPCRNEISISGGIAEDDNGEYLWMPIQDPAGFFGAALKNALVARGIKVNGEVIVDRTGVSKSSYREPLYTHRSAPLITTLALMNKKSDNYSAEYVLRALGMNRHGSGSAEAGIKAIESFMSENGIDDRQIQLLDGCGLARRNLVSARGLVSFLSVMNRHKYSDAYKYTLSHSGIDGTLSGRLSSQKLAGRVRAKTGTITNVSSLAGYLTLASGEEIVFAMICNNFRTSRHLVRHTQDVIIERIYDEYSY